MSAQRIIRQGLPCRRATARQAAGGCATRNIARRGIAGRVAATCAGHTIQMVGVAIRVAAACWAIVEAIQHIIRVTLLILGSRQRPWCQAQTGRCARRSRPGQAIERIITEGLIIGPCGQRRVGRYDIAPRIKTARLVKQGRATGQGLGLGRAQIQVVGPVPGIRVVTDAGAK